MFMQILLHRELILKNCGLWMYFQLGTVYIYFVDNKICFRTRSTRHADWNLEERECFFKSLHCELIIKKTVD